MENISSFNLRLIQTNGPTPTPRKRCLAVTVGDNIYYLGGISENTKETASAVISVFDTKSSSWSSIQTTPSFAYNSEYLQGAVIGTNIWVLSDDKWSCFDTVQKQWRQIQVKSHRKLYHIHAFAIVGDTIYYYDNFSSSLEKKVYRFNTSTNEISTSAEEGIGQHPQERSTKTFLAALSDDIILLYAPYPYYDAKLASEFGEVLYYDLKEDKWARAKESANEDRINIDLYNYAGKVGAQMIFVPVSPNERNKLRILDVEKMTWHSHKLSCDKDTIITSAKIMGDMMYCWLANGQMGVLDVKTPSSEEQMQIDQRLAEVAKTALDNIIRPITVVPQEFKADPIMIDTGLDPVNLNDVKIHYQMTTTFAKLFPKFDEQTKIIENAVPEPSNTTYLHQNLMHYLMLAWSNHFSVVLSPDMIFYTVLCEIADEILSDPEVFRHLFTNSTEKKPIMTITTDVTKIDLNQVIEGIAQNMPIDASIFTANFSSSTVESRLAIQAAFCEAMSAYFYYISTLCGIPRVKVLGTKQDWQTLEHKIHRMRTEVFNQDTTTAQKMSAYLQRAETQVHKIHTTRDPAFWKDMFSINRCMSGHTDVVEGWIVMFYREGCAYKEHGVLKYEGNDFYNYKSHISTVKWHNADTQRHFELKSGLLYSNVVRGDSDDDVKYPWLEPQFSHVIVETDGSGKMTPEQFKKYIDETLQGEDIKLMNEFYEVLKDDPIEVVSEGPKKVDFRFQLVTRQIDTWMNEYTQDGVGMTSLDLSTGASGLALKFYSEIREENRTALNALAQKIEEYLNLNNEIKSINMGGRLGLIEGRIIEFLTKMEDPSRIEELIITGDYTDAYEKLAIFLMHPKCQLRKIHIQNKDLEDWNPDRTPLAKALTTTTVPLETLIFDKIENLELAKAISHLCRKENGLKHFATIRGTESSDCEIEILRGIAESKTLETIAPNDLGMKRITTDDGRTEFVKVVDRDLTRLLMQKLPQKTSLQTITHWRYMTDPLSTSRMLSIPSLRNLGRITLTDLSFLAVTTKLEKLNAELKQITPEQMKHLVNLISREDSKLESLEIPRAELEYGAGSALAKAFWNNTSLKTLDLNHAVIKGDSNVRELMEAISDWLSQPSCNIEYLDLSDIYESNRLIFFGEYLRNIFAALASSNKIKWLKIAVMMELPELDLLTELIRKSTSLTHIKLLSVQTNFTDEQKAPLVAAVKANNNLVEFVSYFTSTDENKSPKNDEDYY